MIENRVIGGKEEKTDHPVVATVGIRHRDQEKRLKADAHVTQVRFELNSGGHFADSGKRLAKGLKWMLSK